MEHLMIINQENCNSSVKRLLTKYLNDRNIVWIQRTPIELKEELKTCDTFEQIKDSWKKWGIK